MLFQSSDAVGKMLDAAEAEAAAEDCIHTPRSRQTGAKNDTASCFEQMKQRTIRNRGLRAANELVNGYLQQMTVQPSFCARGCSVFVAYDGAPEVRPFCNTAARLKLDQKLLWIADCLRQPRYYYMPCGVSARCIPEVE